jgi:hypothetical protein
MPIVFFIACGLERIGLRNVTATTILKRGGRGFSESVTFLSNSLTTSADGLGYGAGVARAHIRDIVIISRFVILF